MEIDALGLLASYLKLDMQNRLIQQGHVSSSELLHSIDVSVNEVMGGFEIIGTAIYYGKFVDQGRKPGARGIPIDDLIKWIRISKKQIPGMKERSQAFMFQASIKAKGIKPSHFITDTLEQNAKEIDEYITEACSTLVNTRIEEIFNSIIS